MINNTKFLTTLKNNAYENLDCIDYAVDLQGWKDKSFDVVFRNFISGKPRENPLMIIEVGTWKGLSTLTMASICKEMGFKDFKIIAIDTWLGAPEFWVSGYNDPTRGGSLNLVNGYPSVFYTFTKNVKSLGHHDVIIPFPISSMQGADVLTSYGIKADLIYVDASHEHKPVLQDIDAYYPLLKEGGMMFGDDYSTGWPGVIKAVDEYAKICKKEVCTDSVVWSYSL